MKRNPEFFRSSVAIVAAAAMVFAPAAPLLAAPAGPQAASPSPGPAKPAATPAASPGAKASPAAKAQEPAPPDGGWPRAYATPTDGKIIVYQPQVASWDGRKHMVAYSAVSFEAKGATKPAMGSIKIEADTKVALEDRLVSFSDLKITESNFPTVPKEQMRDVVNEIQDSIPTHDRVIALDRVLASVDRSQIIPKETPGVKADPPTIFFSKKPALLVNLDSDPIWSPIKDNDLKFAVNTNWDLFFHEPSKVYYLVSEQSFLQAQDVKGPWTAADKLPDSFKKLPGDDNFKDVKAALPGKKLSADKLPQVFISTTPAEMILTVGEPKYQQAAGQLQWVSNTESDVFRMGTTGAVYYLVAGRWFSAPDFTGPWTFATPSLPADFQNLTLEHPRSRVLASVPGTQQAAEAVLLAQVPQTARVNKKELKAPEVVYQGDPKFEAVEKTKVERAVNTDKSIIKVGDMYYMCYEGVWFMGSSPNGPWSVASKVPGEIYEIPISSPAHNVTYVTVEDDDDDEWVTFATAAMYTGVMVAWGCAVWGSGWYYPPYYGGFYGGYPMYRGYYPTYGYGAYYNPYTGAYGRGAVAYGPYGGAGVSARYNPRTGTYSRGAAAYGPYGSRAAGQAYNPRTGTYAQGRAGSNVYGSWGGGTVQRGDQWAQTARVTNRATGTTTRATRTDSGAGAITRRGPGADSGAIRTGSGDVYAGRDGNVYRNQGGSWQKYDNGSWGNIDRPTPQSGTRSAGSGATTRDRSSTTGPPASSSTMDSLNRDHRARSEGSQRTRDYGSYQRSGGGRSSAGSYRGGGGSRGGGRGGGRRR
jgi:hypothetical protein